MVTWGIPERGTLASRGTKRETNNPADAKVMTSYNLISLEPLAIDKVKL
jgi:hypothetical protein